MGTDDELELRMHREQLELELQRRREELEDKHDLDVLNKLQQLRQERDRAALELAAKAKEAGLNPEDYAPRRGRSGAVGSSISVAGGSSVSISFSHGECLVIRSGQRVSDENSQKYTPLVEAVLGPVDRVRPVHFPRGEEVVSVPFVEYENGMLYVPATDELTCNVRHPQTGLVLQAGYTPLEQRFSRRIEHPTLSNGITLDRRVTALKYSIKGPIGGSCSFDICARDVWLEGTKEDTHGFSVLYTYTGVYNAWDQFVFPVKKKEVRIHDREYIWVCDSSKEGILSQARLRYNSSIDRNEDIRVISFDREDPPVGGPFPLVVRDPQERHLRELLERYQLTRAIQKPVDWDATLKNMIKGNDVVLAYASE